MKKPGRAAVNPLWTVISADTSAVCWSGTSWEPVITLQKWCTGSTKGHRHQYFRLWLLYWWLVVGSHRELSVNIQLHAQINGPDLPARWSDAFNYAFHTVPLFNVLPGIISEFLTALYQSCPQKQEFLSVLGLSNLCLPAIKTDHTMFWIDVILIHCPQNIYQKQYSSSTKYNIN